MSGRLRGRLDRLPIRQTSSTVSWIGSKPSFSNRYPRQSNRWPLRGHDGLTRVSDPAESLKVIKEKTHGCLLTRGREQ
jgi:hypothetical protein